MKKYNNKQIENGGIKMKKYNSKKMSIAAMVVMVMCLVLLNVGMVSAATIAHWSMDEGIGTTINDSTGVNNGTINGASWVSGGGLNFDGASNNVNCGNNASLSPISSLNVEAWIKLDAGYPEWMCVVSKEGYASGYGLVFNYGHIGAYLVTSDNGGKYVAIAEGLDNYIPQAYDTINWHKVGMYYDGSTFTLKWDDNTIGSRPMTGNVVANSMDLRIGSFSSWGDMRYFKGSIKDVTISDNTVVPEPGSLLALGSGLLGLVGFVSRRRK